MSRSREYARWERFNQEPKDGERDVFGREGSRTVSSQGPGKKQKMFGPGS